MSQFLVTGGTGFIGRAVTRELLRRDHRVRILTRHESRASLAPGTEFVVGDLRKPDSLPAAVESVDGLIHLAGQTGGGGATTESLRANNVVGTESLTQAAVAAGVRLIVHVSTASVYGPPSAEGNRDEDFPTQGKSAYAVSKLAGEAALRKIAADRLTWTILRPGLVFGPESESFKNLLAHLRRRSFALTTPGDERINPVYVEDLARVIVRVAEDPEPGATFNVGGPRSLPLEEFRDQIAHLAGISRHRWALPSPLATPMARIVGLKHSGDSEARHVLEQKARGRRLDAAIDTERLVRRYATRFTPLDEALQETLSALAGD